MNVAIVAFSTASTRKISNVCVALNVPYLIVLPDEEPSRPFTHIILSGGPDHVYQSDHTPLPSWVIQASCPVLAICYGMQLVAHTFGGTVVSMSEPEMELVPVTEIIDGLQTTTLRWMNRQDRVVTVPKPFMVTGVTHRNHIASFTDGHKYYAVQYHPEHQKALDYALFQRFLNV